MTQEQKAKAYDEALNWMREIYPGLHGATKEDAEHFFPELKESEDERIRKELIGMIKACTNWAHKKEYIAYLEKHKESLPISEMCKENANSFADGIIEVRSFQRGMEEGRRLEKQKEQKDYRKLYEDIAQSEWFKKAYAGKSLGEEFEQKEQKPVECIEFDNEFEKQVSHLLASVLNGEWEYNEDFVKYAAQSLLGFAKNEMKPDEWDKREKLFRKALQAANARIGQLFEENQKLKEQKLEKYAQRLQKEQKQAQTSDEKEYVRTIKSIISDFIRDKKPENLAYYQRIYDWLDGRHVPFSCGHENGKPTEWDNLQEEFRNINEAFEDGKKEVIDHPDKYGLTKQKTPDPVFSKQEYESYPIISTDTTSAKPADLDGKALLYTADKSYQIGFRDGVASVKPEWSEEDGKTINDACCWIAEYAGYLMDKNYGKASMLMGLTDKLKSLRPQPKQEWSDEDSIAIKVIQMALAQYCTSESQRRDLCRWLDLHCNAYPLPEKLIPHWKPSEQEKGALRTAIYVLTEERNFPKAAAQLQNILDAFEGKESRKDWKPSEEQMDRLFSIVAALRKDCCDDMADFLASIYHNLKKLM